MKISGHIVDVVGKKIFQGELLINEGIIKEIEPADRVPDVYILPGLIDAHVHIESSMLCPSQFAKLVVRHGTVATVSDPHEIANVLGVAGIDFMIRDIRDCHFRIYFGAPSCVPATGFESSGSAISVRDIGELMQRQDIYYLSEMMNYPGVVNDDPEVLAKIKLAQMNGKPVDGHAPGLTGISLAKYVNAGISTDHECVSYQEAREKIFLGMKILIREGSSAKNFDALYELIDKYPDMVMLCTDDSHPDDLVKFHIRDLILKGLRHKLGFFNLIRAATFNPVKHYKLDTGLLQKGDHADFIVIDNLEDFNILSTYIRGNRVFDGTNVQIGKGTDEVPNRFHCRAISVGDISVKGNEGDRIRVIEAVDGELITRELITEPKIEDDKIVPDTGRDILKIVVMNRYRNEKPVTGFIKNFGLKTGAMAGSIAHDSHNIIGIGATDADLVNAINAVVEAGGGIAWCDKDEKLILELPVAGLMSHENGEKLAEKYGELDRKVKQAGSKLKSPYMTLSFMALLVIPDFKIGDKGLFDGKNFRLTGLFADQA